MIIIEKNTGEKISYEVNGSKITFRDELTLDLSKYERDYQVNLDICENRDGILIIGLSDYYVAQLEIPSREYLEVENSEGTEVEEDSIKLEPVPFNMDRVTLILWAIKEGAI